MSEKEKMLKLINEYGVDSFEGLIFGFLAVYKKDFSAKRLLKIIVNLNDRLSYKLDHLESIKCIANERATYLKEYLNGNMWHNEEDAKANIQPQMDNVQAIIDACAE